jgi:hypothetical protein
MFGPLLTLFKLWADWHMCVAFLPPDSHEDEMHMVCTVYYVCSWLYFLADARVYLHLTYFT